MTTFIRAANPIWFFVDLVGQPLNDQYYISFLTNTLPYIPQPIFQDPAGTIPWSDPLQFLSNGTLPDNMFFADNLTWRLEIRRGPLSSDPLIYEINNFVPGMASIIPTVPAVLTAPNQATNPQFSTVNFTTPLAGTEPQITITTPGTHHIAPGWELVLTGAGTCIVTQLILSGVSDATAGSNNPPYALQINTNGFTTCDLIQQLNQNGSIWNGGTVGFSFTGKANISAQTVSLLYNPSGPANMVQIFSGLLNTGNITQFGGFKDIPFPSINTDLSTVANTQMIIRLPGTSNIEITNVQFMGQSTPAGISSLVIPTFQQESNERYIDHEFHVFSSELINKPKKSIVVGWNFPLNPWQFYDSATVVPLANQTQYTADQTIIHQETNNGLLVKKNTLDQRQNLLVKSVNGIVNNRFAIIQYIDPLSIKPYWSYILSSLSRMRIFTSHGTQVRVKLRLIHRSSLPPVIGAAEPITGWDGNGDVIFSAGWTAIKPLNDPAYILPNSYENGLNTTPKSYPGFSYNAMQLPESSNANDTLGIVLYTMDVTNEALGTEDSIAFDRISLIPSQFAADAFPQTFDESLRECQFYYEKSYDNADLPGTATNKGELQAEQTVTVDGVNPIVGIITSFSFPFNTVKRNSSPLLKIYSPDGTIDTIRMSVTNGRNPASLTFGNVTIADWVQFSISSKYVNYNPNNAIDSGVHIAQVGSFAEAYITFQYTIGARLGILNE